MARLATATGNWARENLLGSGGTGDVYRGLLDGAPHAVKLLKLAAGAASTALEELSRRFAAELTTLANYRHSRIVRLTHYSLAAGDGAAKRPFALVFELLEEGSLRCCSEGRAVAAPALPAPPAPPA